MSYVSFRDYINKIDKNQSKQKLMTNELIFKATNYSNIKYLAFEEFLLGLAVMDPNSKVRCSYIFRYYDSNSDRFLDKTDLIKMVYDIRKLKNKPIDNQSIDENIDEINKIPNLVDNNKISYNSFLSAIGSLKFRGTAALFRSDISLQEMITTKNFIKDSVKTPFAEKIIGIRPRCGPNRYQLAVHSVKLKFSGRIVDPKSVLFTDGTDVSFKLEDQFTEMSRKQTMESVFKA